MTYLETVTIVDNRPNGMKNAQIIQYLDRALQSLDLKACRAEESTLERLYVSPAQGFRGAANVDGASCPSVYFLKESDDGKGIEFHWLAMRDWHTVASKALPGITIPETPQKSRYRMIDLTQGQTPKSNS